jgi:hypothetical protein
MQQELALMTLSNLASVAENKTPMLDAGALPILIELLDVSNSSLPEQSARVIQQLAIKGIS